MLHCVHQIVDSGNSCCSWKRGREWSWDSLWSFIIVWISRCPYYNCSLAVTQADTVFTDGTFSTCVVCQRSLLDELWSGHTFKKTWDTWVTLMACHFPTGRRRQMRDSWSDVLCHTRVTFKLNVGLYYLRPSQRTPSTIGFLTFIINVEIIFTPALRLL